jgi:phytoene dehydrogenase-like protein
LSAAIVLAQAGCKVLVIEAEPTIGGGARSAELTMPGFRHDVCSAVYPFAAASPFFRSLPLDRYGLEWIEPPAAVAHPFDNGTAALLVRSVQGTARRLGRDAGAYERLMAPLVADWPRLEAAVLGPLRWPRHPLVLARFGLHALRSASAVIRRLFRTEDARALLAGASAHGMMPLDKLLTAGVGMTLGLMGHLVGWPVPRGGAQRICDALAAYLRSLGGDIVTGTRVRSANDLPDARAVLFDLSPRPLLSIAAKRFPYWYRRKLARYRYGPAAFKVDWALDAPIPWRSAECVEAATVHLGGRLDEIERVEREPWEGRHAARPFVILAQPTLFDPSRAPDGRHTAWAYCHVPNGSRFDMLPRIEAQIERFAPGFRDRVLARHVMPPEEVERHNANLVGGDIASGVPDIRQFFTRPTARTYSTPVKGWYICSASTPPGVGVHGMCGYFAARLALKEVWGVQPPTRAKDRR